jgi:N-acetylmuramoyl-L-alanine amidase
MPFHAARSRQVSPSYQLGDQGPAVAEIRSKLAILGLLPPGQDPHDDDLFDDTCDFAVRQFQQQRGLTVDGIVGPQTYRVLDEARWRLGDRVLSYRVSHPLVGDDVAQLQRRMLDMGFDCGRIDGIFGANTLRALREFQRNVGLNPDGTCGPATFAALERLVRTVTGGRPYALRESELIRRAGPALAGKVIVVDPGLGPTNGRIVRLNGTGAALSASEIVHDVARRIEGRLTALGVTAYLSRGPDTDLDETARAEFANATTADLLISLHVDEHPNPLAQGVATFYYGNDRLDGYSAAGEMFAGLVQREIVARTGLVNCYTHGKTWDILRRTRMPAVRVEIGYITNGDDATRLSAPHFRDCLAEAVVVAVQRLYLPPDDDAPTGAMQLPAFAH